MPIIEEIEVLILEINPSTIITKLEKLGATKLYDGPVHAIKMDYPNRSLKEKGSTLRIRTLGEKVEVTYKGKKQAGNLKHRSEIEFNTSELEATIKLFEAIGLAENSRETKHRTLYQLGDIKYAIDNNPAFPPYLEIESTNERKVEQGVINLGYSMNQTVNFTTSELYKHYNIQRTQPKR